MGAILRTFVAIRCGAAVRKRLRREADRLARLDDAFRPTAEADLHLTVQFLGDTREDDVVPLTRALAEAARTSAPMTVAYGGLGAFPSPARARVVWAGIREEPAGGLAALAREVGTRLRALGYPPEDRGWSGHVTLGRIKRRPAEGLVAALDRGAEADLGTEIVSDLKLILSRPQEGAYHYIDLTTIPLGPAGPR